MKAISTKYLGPTDYRGSRVKAFDGDGNQVTLSWDSEYNADENHARAAKALCVKMGWDKRNGREDNRLIGGGTKDGWVWVFACSWSTIDLDGGGAE